MDEDIIGRGDSAEWNISSAALRNLHLAVNHEQEDHTDVDQRVYPDDRSVQFTAIVDELTTDIAGLETIVARLQEQNDELKQDLDRETQYQKQHDELNVSLMEKWETHQANHQDTTHNTVLTNLKNRHRSARHYLKEIDNKFIQFTNEHFPPQNKKDEFGKEIYSVCDIVEKLVAAYLKSPEDMYLTLTSRYPREYTHMLLRYGIIEHHPEDSRRIRIVPFFK